jgi:hypothetical protein
MLIFLREWLFVLAMVIALGLVGGFALVPFRAASPFIVLAAPLAGFLLLGLGISSLYSGLSLSVSVASVAVLSVGGLATLASLIALRRSLADRRRRAHDGAHRFHFDYLGNDRGDDFGWIAQPELHGWVRSGLGHREFRPVDRGCAAATRPAKVSPPTFLFRR